MKNKFGWEIKKIGDVCDVFNGGTPDTTVKEYWDGDNLWITPKDMGKLTSKFVDKTERKLTDDGVKNSSARLLPINSVIMSSRAPIGHLAINTLPICTNQGCKGMVPKKGLNSNYLYYFLSNSVQLLNDIGSGATFKEISGTKLSTVKIPVPPLPTQHQIVSELDALSEIISKKKQQIEELDNLAQATFYDMFGDPVTNEKGLPILFWNKIFNTTTGKLNANAMCDDGIYPFFTCSKQEYRINEYAFDCEALLLAGNNATANYDVKHYKGKFNAYQRTYILTLKNSEWEYPIFKFQLEDKLEHLQQQSIGANTKYLTLTILNKLSFILPPKQLQREFSKKIESIESQKSLIIQSIAEVQQLFDYTMDKYFN